MSAYILGMIFLQNSSSNFRPSQDSFPNNSIYFFLSPPFTCTAIIAAIESMSNTVIAAANQRARALVMVVAIPVALRARILFRTTIVVFAVASLSSRSIWSRLRSHCWIFQDILQWSKTVLIWRKCPDHYRVLTKSSKWNHLLKAQHQSALHLHNLHPLSRSCPWSSNWQPSFLVGCK